MWTQERCVNPISKTKSKLYNLSEVGHLHPYIGARVEWFKESWVFAHRADVTVALAVTFDSPEVQRDWCAFPGPMTQQCKLKSSRVVRMCSVSRMLSLYTHTQKKVHEAHITSRKPLLCLIIPLTQMGFVRLSHSTQTLSLFRCFEMFY